MSATLRHHSYGKSAVRLTKVVRDAARHEIIEMNISIALEGDFAASYTAGDNSNIIATDSMKNAAYVLGKENDFPCIEAFGVLLARHFCQTYPQVSLATIEIAQTLWNRIAVNGRPHDHAFTSGSTARRICRVALARGQDAPSISGGIAGLGVLKTTASEFSGFVTDRYRTLKDTHDRIFATTVDATWDFLAAEIDFNTIYEAIVSSLLETFATHYSLAVQQTLLAMGEAALARCPAISRIALTMPNQHRVPFNLEPFGMRNENDIFITTGEPYGVISGVVERQ